MSEVPEALSGWQATRSLACATHLADHAGLVVTGDKAGEVEVACTDEGPDDLGRLTACM